MRRILYRAIVPLFAILVCSLVFPAVFSSQNPHKQMEVVDLGTLGGQDSRAYAINNHGEIVGNAATLSGGHAFIYKNGIMLDLDTTGSNQSWAFDINISGQAVGAYTLSGGGFHPCFWENGGMEDLGVLPGDAYGQAEAINKWGQVVGTSVNANGENHCFLWEGGTMINIGSLGGNYCQANDINNLGEVVGVSSTGSAGRAFVWKNGIMTDLGTLGGPSSIALAINNHGQVVGYANTASMDIHAFLWQAGSMQDLGVPPIPPNTTCRTYAFGINKKGQVVGRADIFSGPAGQFPMLYAHAFLWEDGNMLDLGTLPGNPSIAYDINDSGQIVGVMPGPPGTNSHAFLIRSAHSGNSGELTSSGTVADVDDE